MTASNRSPQRSGRRTDVDPIAGAIVQRLITNAAREMGLTLMRSTRSPVLFEARDFCTGIFDANGRVIEQHKYLPMHAFLLPPVVAEVIRVWGQRLLPGDVFIHNDPFRGGNHAMDVSIVRPLFADKELVGWAACKGHMLDWGGPVASGYNAAARSAWDEPLRVPAIHLYRAGQRCDETFSLIEANIRAADIVLHDIEAMAGSTAIGERRMREIVERFGLPAFRGLVDAWLAATRVEVERCVGALPDGFYHGTSRVQYKPDQWADVVVSVQISGADIVFDLSGTSPQTQSYVNAPLPVTHMGVLQCMAMLLAQDMDPSASLNAGFTEAIQIRVPPRTILSAEFPAAVGYCNHLSDQITEAVFKALAEVLPGRVTGGWAQWGTTVSGTWQGRSFATPLFFASKGGSGATDGVDGYDFIGSIRMAGALEAEDVEMLERVHGWIDIRKQAYWPDSGGAGQWRGGLGVCVEAILDGDDMMLAAFGSGRDEGAFGLFDGSASPLSKMLLVYPDGTEIDVPALANIDRVPPGTMLKKWNTGGGGYGPPRLRALAKIERDLCEGYITAEQARDVYHYPGVEQAGPTMVSPHAKGSR
jgi:N-methylhydantoinase B